MTKPNRDLRVPVVEQPGDHGRSLPAEDPKPPVRRRKKGVYDDIATIDKDGKPDRDGRIRVRRARAVVEAVQAAPESPFRGVLLEYGGVAHHVEWVRPEQVDGAQAAVRIRPMGGSPDGQADVVVVNPPLLVRDPQGLIVLDGVAYREDPMAALAEVLTRHLGGRS